MLLRLEKKYNTNIKFKLCVSYQRSMWQLLTAPWLAFFNSSLQRAILFCRRGANLTCHQMYLFATEILILQNNK